MTRAERATLLQKNEQVRARVRRNDRQTQSNGAQRMSEKMTRVSVRILEKEYQVACPMEERSDLLDSAELLNSKMREIRDAGNVVGDWTVSP